MNFEGGRDNSSLHANIARQVHDGLLRGDYALLGVYLPDEVLDHVARLCGEHMNSFGYENGRATLKIVAPLLSKVLDDVRDHSHPNRRWCVLAKNVCRIFEKTRGSLCGADLSGLDLTECDFSTAALGSMGLAAKLDNSLIRFDSFVRYRLPGLRQGEKPQMALDVSETGKVMMGCGGLLMHIVPEMPLRSRVICDISAELGEGWRICKLRYDRAGKSVMISATNDLAAFDASTSLHPYTEGYVPLRRWLFDGANLIPCHDERETGPGGVIRNHGGESSVFLESWELARFKERHCWELDTGDPMRDELSAKDRLFSGSLRYKYENNRITDRYTRIALSFVYAGAASVHQAGRGLCAVNTTVSQCELDKIHPDSIISPEQLTILKGNQS
ncbi:MAG: hypothetical protein PUB32_02760 [Clostridiales bacterium]|nr:hypothetical protein [Clostridiales bacterium]